MAWRKQLPRCGAKKIRLKLTPAGWLLPAVSRMLQVLIRRGLAEHVQRRREPPGGWRTGRCVAHV